MAVMAWGENIQIFMELGFPTQVFTLDSATDGVLDSDFLDGTLVGEDVSQYAQQVSISRGRSDQLQNFNAGTFSVQLLNRDRRFDPINQSSPYWNSTLGVSGVAPRRKVTVFSNGVALFSGRITDIDVSYEPNQPSATSENSYVTITASDDFVLLASTYTGAAITPTEVLSGTRVTEILDLPEVNYPATRNIDAGSAALGGGATFEIPANTNVLTYLQSVGTSEQGYFFVAANGDLTFTDRITSAFSSPAAYFSDAGTNIPYTNLSVMYGQEFLYNKVVCQVEGGTDQIANDVASQAEYGISTLNLSGLLLVDDAAASTLASDLLGRYKLPEYRFDKLQTVYNRLGAVDQATLTGIDIADVVSITRTYPTGTPTTVTKQYSIENIRHVITPNSHTVEFGLSVADIVYPFILAGFPVPTVSRTNLILNPNFETDVSNWVAGNGATISRSTAYQVSGVASALLTSSVTDYNNMQLPTRIAVSPNTAYSLSAYCRNISGNTRLIYIAAQWYTAGGAYISEINSGGQGNLAVADGWVRRTTTGVSPANAASVQIVMLQGQTGLSAGWQSAFDGVLFEQSSSVLPYFDGTYVNDYAGYGLNSKGWNGTANASSSTTSWFVGNSRTNLVTNPSFETDTTSWGAFRSTLSRVAGTFGTGSWVGQFVATSTLTGGANRTFVPIPNQSYTVSGTVLRTVGSRTYAIVIDWYNSAGYVSSSIGTSQTCATATRLSATGIAPAGAVSATITFNGSAGAIGDTAQVDSVLVEQTASVLPYFDGTYVDAYAGFGLYSKAWDGTANASTSTTSWYVGNSRTNLVTNPSLETNATGWNAASSPAVRSTDFALSGTASFKVTMSSASDNNIMVNTPNFAGTGNATFSVYAYVPVGSTLAGLSVTLSVEGGTAIASLVSSTPAVLVADSWVRMNIVLNVTVAGTMVVVGRLSALPSTRAGQNIYFDSALAEFSSTALPYFDGTYADTYSGYTLESQAWNGTADASTSTASWGLSSSYVGTPMDSDYALS